jgi:superfamily II DNA or RNA helicase
MLLAENRITWETLGPRSDVARRNPDSNTYQLWELRRADRIAPNNRKIVNLIRANRHLLDDGQAEAFAAFVNHADAYEENVYERLDEYPQFPHAFEEAFR